MLSGIVLEVDTTFKCLGLLISYGMSRSKHFRNKARKIVCPHFEMQLLHGIHTSQGILSCSRTRKNLPVECVISLGRPAVMNYGIPHTFHHYEIIGYTLNSVFATSHQFLSQENKSRIINLNFSLSLLPICYSLVPNLIS